jgi:hypothetical protein
LDSAHFGSNALQVIAQALLGLKSLETPRVDIGNALLGCFSQNRKTVRVLGVALLQHAQPLAQNLTGILIAATLDQLLDQSGLMVCQHDISGGHGGLIVETRLAYCANKDGREIAEGKTTTALVLVRVNQARFRRAILASYNATCCMSGLRVPKLLVASHIVPWSMDTQNRLNPTNGLCLSALHDRAYDQGLITVLPDFTIRVTEDLRRPELDPFAQTSLAQCQGQAIRLPERFRPAPAFLEAHARRFGFL